MNLPNYISVFRILLVPIFFMFLIDFDAAHTHYRPIALAIFLVAITTDALDGIIARQLKQQTKLGTFLDPFADKLLLLTAFLGIACTEWFVIKPPNWIVILIVFRDLFILGGMVTIFFTTNQLVVEPNLIGKCTTFFQMMTIVAVLWQWTYAPWVWIPAAVFTMFSGMSYLTRGIKLLNRS